MLLDENKIIFGEVGVTDSSGMDPMKPYSENPKCKMIWPTKKNTAKNRGKKANPEDEFKFKSIRISNRNIIDYTGHKRYRTVYRSNEVEAFYIDTEWINKRYDESSWNASIVVGLFFMDEDNPVMVAKKEEAVVIPKDMNVFNYSVSFVLADLNS